MPIEQGLTESLDDLLDKEKTSEIGTGQLVLRSTGRLTLYHIFGSSVSGAIKAGALFFNTVDSNSLEAHLAVQYAASSISTVAQGIFVVELQYRRDNQPRIDALKEFLSWNLPLQIPRQVGNFFNAEVAQFGISAGYGEVASLFSTATPASASAIITKILAPIQYAYFNSLQITKRDHPEMSGFSRNALASKESVHHTKQLFLEYIGRPIYIGTRLYAEDLYNFATTISKSLAFGTRALNKAISLVVTSKN